MGIPGCPEFACWTASMASTRKALARVLRLGAATGGFGAGERWAGDSLGEFMAYSGELALE